MGGLIALLLFGQLGQIAAHSERPAAILPSIPQIPTPSWLDRGNRKARRRDEAERRAAHA